MNVLAINTSPKMDKGNTAIILNPFLEGMRSAGAEVELVNAQKLKIGPCLSCWNCILKTPGECVQKDDMDGLFLKMFMADAMVWATPIYIDGPTAQMKTILDRSFRGAGFNPGYEIRNGHQRLKLPEGFVPRRGVLVSTCGFHEMDNFNSLLNYMETYSRQGTFEFVGALLRPHANVFLPQFELELNIDDIIQAAKEAGGQFVRDGRMKQETLSIVSREILPIDEYIRRVNQFIEKERKKL
jgi:multimeric flavodoxin WrbA